MLKAPARFFSFIIFLSLKITNGGPVFVTLETVYVEIYTNKDKAIIILQSIHDRWGKKKKHFAFLKINPLSIKM